MRKYIRALFLFFSPSVLISLFYSLKQRKRIKHIHIGFSFVIVENLIVDEKCYIGNGNKIFLKNLVMRKNSSIKEKNLFKGTFDVVLHENSAINYHNKFYADNSPYTNRILELGHNTIIGIQHSFDLTRSVTIGSNSIFAGSNSQVWTHSFYHAKEGEKRWRIDSDVHIGNNVYIGSICVLCPGIHICDSVHIGAAVCISKDISQPGLYVNQPIRFIELDPDEAVKKYTVIQKEPFAILEK